MDINEMNKQIEAQKAEKEKTLALYEKSLLIYDKQKEALTLQFEAIKENPAPIKENCRYMYELSDKHIKSRIMMEEARLENDVHQIELKKENIKTQIKQLKLELE